MRVGEDGEGWESAVEIICRREGGREEGLEERVTEVGVVGHGCGNIPNVVCLGASMQKLRTSSRVLGLESVNPAMHHTICVR